MQSAGTVSGQIAQDCVVYADNMRSVAQAAINNALKSGSRGAVERIKSKGLQAQLAALPQRYPEAREPIALADEAKRPIRCQALHAVNLEILSGDKPQGSPEIIARASRHSFCEY